jgi:ABC-type lipopolysaccharide export system ATPase subunit
LQGQLAGAMSTRRSGSPNRGYIIVHGEIVVAASSVDELRGNDIVRRLYLGGTV